MQFDFYDYINQLRKILLQELIYRINKIATLIAGDAKMSYLIGGFSHYKICFHDVKTINEDEFKIITKQLENSSYKF